MRSISSPLGGEQDHRHVLTRPSQTAQDSQPVLVRQHQIEHQQVVAIAHQGAIHLAAVRDRFHFIALLAQIAQQQLAQTRVVVNNQDSVCVCHDLMIKRTIAQAVINCEASARLKQIVTYSQLTKTLYLRLDPKIRFRT